MHRTAQPHPRPAARRNGSRRLAGSLRAARRPARRRPTIRLAQLRRAIRPAQLRPAICPAQLLAALAVVAATLSLTTAAADAARKPASRAEATAIKRPALAACNKRAPDPCRVERVRVSTRDPRFAWATVLGEGFSGTLLKRVKAHPPRFRVIGWQGGGIGSCRYWRARAPGAVLRDLRIQGLDIATGKVGPCG
jgi:hypothetical protein